MKSELRECPNCGAPCTRTVNMRGGEYGWGTSDEERADYRYAAPALPAPGEAVPTRDQVRDLIHRAYNQGTWGKGYSELMEELHDLYATAPPQVGEWTDEECDKLVAQTMDKVAAAKDMHATEINPDITTHWTLRRAIVRAALKAAHAARGG